MSLVYEKKTYTSRRAWRRYAEFSELRRSAELSDANDSGTLYGEVLAGTLMARNAAGTHVRPLALQSLASPIVSGNEGEFADAAGFYVGDVVDVVAHQDFHDEGSIDASGSGDTILATALEAGDSRIRVILTDPSATNQALNVVISDSGTNLDIDVLLATDGGGAITSTVQDVIDALNDEAGYLVFAELTAGSGAATAIAVTATALEGGYLQGEAILSGVDVTDVDKASTPNTVTISGSAVDLPAGVVFMLEAMTPARLVGILEQQPVTTQLVDGAVAGKVNSVSLAIMGSAIKARLTGYDDTLERYLAGGYVSEGVLGPGIAKVYKFMVEED
jgi:hypothetical protein